MQRNKAQSYKSLFNILTYVFKNLQPSKHFANDCLMLALRLKSSRFLEILLKHGMDVFQNLPSKTLPCLYREVEYPYRPTGSLGLEKNTYSYLLPSKYDFRSDMGKIRPLKMA